MILKDASGANLSAGPAWKSKNEPQMDALASVPFLVDHDGDGDLDLYVGNIAGRVILIPNVGTAKEYKFDGSKREALQAEGAPIKVEGDSGPVIADWDLDGKADLIVGAGDGAVTLFRNVSDSKEMRYAAGRALLPAAKDPWTAVAHGTSRESHGVRTKVHVTDWNSDGLPDLLVGDFWTQKSAQPKLSEEETKRRDELKARRTTLSQEYSKLWEKLGDAAKTDPKIAEMRKEMDEVYQQLAKLEPSATNHGSVWLYLREKPAR